MDKYFFIGNGTDGWIIKELFKDVVDHKVPFAEWKEPYTFQDEKIRKEYIKQYFSAERNLPKLSNAQWRKYSSLKGLNVKEGDCCHLFFLYGRDIERLFDPILLKWLKQKWGSRVVTYLILLDSIDVTKERFGWEHVTDTFSYFDFVASFDKKDAERYNLICFNTPYSARKLEQETPKYDLYFIGDEKGRGDMLEHLAYQARENGVTTLFQLMNYNGDCTLIEKRNRLVGYDKMLGYVAQSRCIVEILAEGQEGSSLRYYEAVVYNKKLLTNNKNVLSYDFYDARYIQYFERVEDIDFDWIKEDVDVDYCYDERYSVQAFIDQVKRTLPDTDGIKEELVSVVLPVYNREATVLRAINSVLNQTYRNIELIVVDDGSSDASLEIVKSIDDPRIKIIEQQNQGACAARNHGILCCTGSYIAFQDSDDEWELDKLEKQCAVLREQLEIDVVFCNAKKINIESTKEELLLKDIEGGKVSRERLQAYSIVSTQTMLLRRECFEAEMFDVNMPRMQDYDLVVRLSNLFSFWFLPEALAKIYVQTDSISNNPQKALNARYMLFEKYPEMFLENETAYFSALQSIRTNAYKLGEENITANREYFYYKKLCEARKELENYKKLNPLSDKVVLNSQLRFELSGKDCYVTLRRTGTSNSRELQLVTTIDGENKKWNKLINANGSRNWVTPEELDLKLEKFKKKMEETNSYSKKLEYEIGEIRNSFSYKFGRALTYLPRLIRHWVKKVPM